MPVARRRAIFHGRAASSCRKRKAGGWRRPHPRCRINPEKAHPSLWIGGPGESALGVRASGDQSRASGDGRHRDPLRTAIFYMNFYRRSPIDAPTITAARSKIECGFLSKSSIRSEPCFRGQAGRRRVSATDWVEGGWDLEQTIAFAEALKRRGVDWIDASSGGLSPYRDSPTPGYQVPFPPAR